MSTFSTTNIRIHRKNHYYQEEVTNLIAPLVSEIPRETMITLVSTAYDILDQERSISSE